MSTFVTRGRWFGDAARPLLGWLTTPTAGPTRGGVVIVPPLGYEYWSSHRTLRTLAEALAARGLTVLRFDYDATGDSAGERWDGDRVAAWRASVAAAVGELRAIGVTELTVIGLRLGATFALADGAALGVDAVIAWVPVTSGKRFGKEMRMLGLAVPEGAEGAAGAGAFAFAGVVISAATTAELGKLDVDKLAARPAPRVLIVERPGRPADKLVARLRELGGETDVLALPGSELALDVPAEDATVPFAAVAQIAAWVRVPSAAATPAGPLAPRAAATFAWGAGRVTEEVVELGAARLIGVVGRPATAPARGTTVVFLSSGSEPHVGPGRAWVEYARELAVRGYPTVRLDFRGWGESPDDAHAPGRPYDAHCVIDTLDAVHALHAAGHAQIVVLGLCAGAWIGMRAALEPGAAIAGVIAINPQLYWQPGQPVEALLSDTRVRRTAEREREARGGRNGLWSALDAIGLRPVAARWLTGLRRARVRTIMMFAAGDDGLEYLRNRIVRRLRHELAAGFLEVAEIADIDHQMYREWRRHEVIARLIHFLDAL